MTLPGEGQRFSLGLGTGPQMLTENAPVTVINTSIGTRIWLANSSSVSPGVGVPVEAGTSYTWDTAGQLWAMADPAATETALVIVTGSGSDWAPSPVAIGAAVAAQILTSGVPIVARTEVLFEGIIIPSALPYPGGTGWLDVTGYASLEFAFTVVNTVAPVGSPLYQGIEFQWADTVAQQSLPVMKSDEVTTALAVAQSISVPIRGNYVRLSLTNSFPANSLSNAALTLSTRTVDRARTRAASAGRYAILAFPGQITTAFGTFNEAYALPAEGKVSWNFSWSASVSGTEVVVFSISPSGLRNQLYRIVLGVGNGTEVFDTDSPLLATVFRVRNTAVSGAASAVNPVATRVAV